MSGSTHFTLKLVAALGCGLMAGAFFAFSAFVMSGLARLPAPQGVAAMQSINVTAVTPLFMGVFMGMTLLSLGLGVAALLNRSAPGAGWVLAGSLLYVVGSFGITAACNVPLNDGLAALKPDSAEAASFWATYLSVWTLWNHLRTVLCLGATASFIVALCQAGA